MSDQVVDEARERTGALAVVVVDEAGVVRSWSDGAAKLFGYEVADAVGRDVAELIVPEGLRTRHRDGIDAMARVGPSDRMGGTYTMPAIDAEGRQFPVQMTRVACSVGARTWAAAVITTPGEPSVTAVPRTDALTAVFERAPEAITILDPRGRQITVNAVGAAMTGYGDAGRHPGDGRHYVHPDDRARNDEYFSGVLSGEVDPRTPLRYRVMAGGGGWIWLETVLADLTDVPEVNGFVAFSRDVTQDEARRAELDEAYRLAEVTGTQLRQLADARLTFAATVSHELRTPLTSISSAVETLQYDSALDRDEVDTYLSIIRRNTRRLTRLVEDLLLFSRLEAGLLRLDPDPVDPFDVLSEAADALATRAARRSVSIEIDAVGGEMVRHDADRILQVVQNVVDNAVKFASPSTVVTVTSRVEDGEWTVEVRNRGPVIDQEDVDNIFEPFFRTQRAERGVAGTGLGLPLSRGIVELAGGTLTCDPSVSDGARFVMRVPVDQPDAGSAIDRGR